MLLLATNNIVLTEFRASELSINERIGRQDIAVEETLLTQVNMEGFGRGVICTTSGNCFRKLLCCEGGGSQKERCWGASFSLLVMTFFSSVFESGCGVMLEMAAE